MVLHVGQYEQSILHNLSMTETIILMVLDIFLRTIQ